MSAKNRKEGHRHERHVAHVLRDGLGLDVASSREAAGGTQSGADLVHVLERDDRGRILRSHPLVAGVSWECKRVERWRPHEWIRQAEEDADGAPWAVVAKRQGKGDPAESVAMVPLWLLVELLNEVAVVLPEDRCRHGNPRPCPHCATGREP